MTNELKLIYMLVLKDNLTLTEIAGKDGWQPIIRDMVAANALKIAHEGVGAAILLKETHKFIRNFLIIRDSKKIKKSSGNFNQ